MDPLTVSPGECRRPTAGEVQSEVGSVLSSQSFVHAPRIGQLLQYLVKQALEGRCERLKEAVLGVEVFGREPGYNPQADPIVRVTIRRLRTKLEEYYRREGKDSAVRIELLRGVYAPRFHMREPGPHIASCSAEQQTVANGAAHLLTPTSKNIFEHFRRAKRAAIEITLLPGHSDHPNHPAFSPDGRAIAFDWRAPEDAAESIYVQCVDAEGPAPLTRSTAREVRPAWSPDGGCIAFLREPAAGRLEIRVSPVFGEGDRLLAETAVKPGDLPRVDWFPDGRLLVTSESSSPESPSHLVLISLCDGDRQPITTPPLGTAGDDDGVISPRGDMLAFRRRTAPWVEDVYLQSLTSSYELRRLTFDQCALSGIAWAADGNSLIVSSRRSGGDQSLWGISLSGGVPIRLTESWEAAAWPVICRRGSRMAYVRQFLEGGRPSRQIVIVGGFR